MFNLNQCEDRLLELIEPEEYEDSPIWRLYKELPSSSYDGQRQSQQLLQQQVSSSQEPQSLWEVQRGFYSPSLRMFVECTLEEFQQLQSHLNNINKIKSEASADRLIDLGQHRRTRKEATPKQNPRQTGQRAARKVALTVEL